MLIDEEVELGARLTAVECVLEYLLAAHLAGLDESAARSERGALSGRAALMAQRRRREGDGAGAQPSEADVRHALGNLVQKAMITEGALRHGSTGACGRRARSA